jgi:septation ring formation regulator EzrA
MMDRLKELEKENAELRDKISRLKEAIEKFLIALSKINICGW